MNEFERNFQSALNTVCGIEQQYGRLKFSDGFGGVLELDVPLLRIRDESKEFHSHTHNLNKVLYNKEKVFYISGCEIPDKAQLRANDFLTIGETKYKITEAKLKEGIWHVVVVILSTN